MKNLFLKVVVLSALFLSGSSFVSNTDDAAVEPKKLALIIAIGNYNTNETGWAQISSKNDVPIIKSALEKIGFSLANIDVLQDEAATRDGILKALTNLEAKAAPGDMVTIHISSHGQQISDNQPPDEIDGYDEAIVAYGAPASDKKWNKKTRGGAYDGSLHLRDEDLGSAINDIRAKVGKNEVGKNGHVLVVLDACHSGTGTRGSSKVRGGERPFIIEGAAKPTSDLKREEGGFGVLGEDKKAKTRGVSVKLGEFILISGAAAEEVNYEYEDGNTGYGSLSFCISKILPTLPKGASYRTLFAKLQAEMADKAPKQSPQLEGDVDFEVFGGKYSAQPKYFEILKIVNDKQVKMKAGSLMNIAVGLTVVAEKAGEKPTAGKESFAKGKVINVSNFESTIEFEKPLVVKNAKEAWIYVTGQMVPEVKVKVNLDTIKNAELKKALKSAVAAMGMAEVATGKGKGEITIKEAPSRGVFSLELVNTAFGTKLTDEKPLALNSTEEAVKACTERIQNFAQGKMFKNLDLKADEYDVRITKVIPIKAGSKLLSDSVSMKSIIDKGNSVAVPDGTTIFLVLKNFGDKVAYFNILDIEPSGKISALLPRYFEDGVKPPIQELVLNPGEERPIPHPIRIGPPFGNELLKVIATGTPFDLASTIKLPSVATRGSNNPIQKLIANSSNKEFRTRGTEAEFSDEMGTNTSEFAFKIVKKN